MLPIISLNLSASFEPHFEIGNKSDGRSIGPVKEIIGNGHGWAEIIEGRLMVNGVPGRTTLKVEGPGALHVIGDVEVG